jgi:hypothetical protein
MKAIVGPGGMMNFSEGASSYFEKIMSNPSLENILKTVMDIELDETDDEDVKEIK